MACEIATELGSIRVAWDCEALRSLGGGDGEAPWRIEGDLDWSAVATLRIVSAGFEDGTALGVAALRPQGAAGHDAEDVAGVLAEPDGEARALDGVLISTELGPDGRARRLGLELYGEEDAPPLRAAADAEGAGEMVFRLEGRRGRGRYDVLKAP